MAEYVFDNAAAETEQRFGALDALYDPLTIQHLEPLVVDGSHCLEVGGGSGSIARWMSDRVGTQGRVVVTDINTRFLGGIAAPNLEVREHDIVSDPLEESAFDLTHTRLVLLHIPERERAIERMIAALKPGAWLILQEYDALSMRADPALFKSEHLLKTFVALHDVMTARGVDLRFGRKLPALLSSLGLRDVEAEGYVVLSRGGSLWGRLLRANFEQVHVALIESGVTEAEYAQDLARLDDPAITWPSQILWTVRGRKP